MVRRTYGDTLYACATQCRVDSDGDDVCDQDEVAGCQDEAAKARLSPELALIDMAIEEPEESV